MELLPWDAAVPSETWMGGRPMTGGTVEPLQCSLTANSHLLSIVKYEVTDLLSSGQEYKPTHPDSITPVLASSHCFLLGLVILVILCCKACGYFNECMYLTRETSRTCRSMWWNSPSNANLHLMKSSHFTLLWFAGQCWGWTNYQIQQLLFCSAMGWNTGGKQKQSHTPQQSLGKLEESFVLPLNPHGLHLWCSAAHQGRSHMLWVRVSACPLLNQRMRHLLSEHLEKLLLFLIIRYADCEGRKDHTNLLGLHCTAETCTALHSALWSRDTFAAFGTSVCPFPSCF